MARTLDTPVRAADDVATAAVDWYLRVVVFVSGGVSIGIELAASRLLAPFFGTSLFIWANLIGLTLIYLSIGYAVGGRIADRWPHISLLYGITAVAAFVTGLIPVLAQPILAKSLTAFAAVSLGGFYGSLVGTLVLFAVPVTLLGCVSPFAIRLALASVSGAGNTSGSLYALSTVGSIVGTFVPTFLLIPRIGTFRTFYLFAIVLLVVSLIGLFRAPRTDNRTRLLVAAAVLLVLMLGVAAFGHRGFVRPVEGGRQIIWQGESAYNFIQVGRNPANGANELYLNEGHAIHSLYYPGDAIQPLSNGPWDYFAVAPFFQANERLAAIKDVCIIGLAGGTVAQRMDQIYGAGVKIDGVEIDPKIVEVARQFFNLDASHVNVIVQDGRYYMRTTNKRYDVIAADAYHQPYIPFQLTTQEFFREAYDHLNDNGTFIVNAGRSNTDFRLVNVISDTMRSVFPNVYLIDTPAFTNTMVIGTKNPTTLANFAANINAVRQTDPNSALVTLGDAAIKDGHLREAVPGPQIFTDDLAPVEDLIDRILLDYARKGGT
ncbi:MAG: fused MFS/spermidine synthase [Thermomicrobia bacterium]|nr:fused MFS/spermidine synthase [Thermomicrobia bacterium]